MRITVRSCCIHRVCPTKFCTFGGVYAASSTEKITTPSKTQQAETPHALHKAEGRAEAVLEYLQHAYDNKVVELSATRAQWKADMQVCV